MFLGRRSERTALDGLLEGARGGRSGALVIRGEAGVGKTALLEHAIGSAADLQVARVVGVESEMELAYAALHQLCAPMLDGLERLPAPQRDALGVAFGLTAGTTPDRFLVSLAVLTLVSEAAETQPLLCVIDDAQWLDRASALALAFVARRLEAESVAIAFATREPIEEAGGLPELVLSGLGDSEAKELLAVAVRGTLDERVRDRIIAETRGNPLALLELPRGLAPAELAGGFVLPGALPLPDRIEESFLRRLEELAEDARLLLLVAAAEPVGDPALLWRAAGELRIAPEALEPAVKAGLLEVNRRVRFRHPLVRSAVYRGASPGDRRRAHAALAEATDPQADPDRCVWHRAQATSQPDEDVAAELERSAGGAQARGGLAAAAAFLERATMLTPEPGLRATRALAAAQAKHLAGAPESALELLATARAGPLDELQRARVDLLRAQIAFTDSGGGSALRPLLDAARQLDPLDVELARDTYLEAFNAVVFASRLADDGVVRELAAAARAAPAPAQPRPSDLLLDGLALLFTDGYAAAAPTLKRALSAVQNEHLPIEEAPRSLWGPCQAATYLWDDAIWDELTRRAVRLAREAGALSLLPMALTLLGGPLLWAGEFAQVASLIEESEALTDPGGGWFPITALSLAAMRGREAEVSELIETTRKEVVDRGGGFGLSAIEWASGLLYNGLGRYEEARTAAAPAVASPVQNNHWALPELIEASTRCGNTEAAADALEQLAEMTRPGGKDWGLGIEARSRALLVAGAVAEDLYREAVDRLSRTRIRVELARAHLLYGEWLRRERRRVDAREQLRTAHEMFSEFGMEAFAGRAERELVATGERARKRSVETREDLTAQETQIARLARDGLSNSEIGARLFISPRTVKYHLAKVFGKLGISSRYELDRALPS